MSSDFRKQLREWKEMSKDLLANDSLGMAELVRFKEELHRLAYYISLRLSSRKLGSGAAISIGEVNLSDLMKRLRRKGQAVRNYPSLQDSLEKQAYRLLELIRSGRRTDAFHLLMRTYVAHNQPFPHELVEAFMPIYTAEEAKLLLFSYLSGVTSTKTKV